MDTIRKNKYYRYTLWISFAILTGIVFWQGSTLVLNPEWISADDYLGYWAAGKLQLSGANPFDPSELLRLQKSVGWPGNAAVIMWSPPWTLPLVMVLGAVNYPLSRTFFIFINVAVILISVDLLWKLYKGKTEFRWMSWLIGFTFIPVLDAIKKGQTGILLLLGIAGFLYFQEKNKPWLAGLCLALLAIKPHVAYLFFLAVLLWVFYTRSWSVIGGFILALTVSITLAFIWNPQVFDQYFFAITNFPPSEWVTPTIGGIMRLIFGEDKFWLQFIPPFFGTLWLCLYFLRNKEDWNWLERTPLIILVSLLTAAYGWSFDQPAALVAIIQIFVVISSIAWQKYSILILGSYIMINILNILSPSNEIFLFWLAPTLLIWYLASKWIINNRIERFTIPSLENI